jgi:glycosyltransferase involved in cell wall biosynthesis
LFDIAILRTNSAVNEARITRQYISLTKAGFKVVILAWDREQGQASITKNKRIKQLRIKAPIDSPLLVFFFFPYWLWVTMQLFIEKPSVVHACDFDTMPVAVLAKMVRPRTTLVYDCFEYYPGMINSFLNPLLKSIICFTDEIFTLIADCVIVPSEERMSFYPNARKIIIVPNAPSTIDVPTDEKSNADFTLFYGGGLEADRGISTILRAAASLSNIKFVIAGEGTLKAVVEKYATQYKNIEYLGMIPNNVLLQKMANAQVTVAFYEASNLNNLFAASSKVFESMMLGVPVITNKESVSSKTLLKHNCGLAVPYGNVGALISAILELRSNPSLRKKLGQNGKSVFTNLYAWDVIEPEYISQYRDILRVT